VNAALRALAIGAAAGAAGTTALNAVTYFDMAARGRPASDTPGQTVQRLAEVTHLSVPGNGESRANRVAGLGPLAGLITGVGAGVLLSLARAAGWRPGLAAEAGAAAGLALLGSNGPMTALGITDPRTWPASSWVSDVVPHLAYGAVAACVLRGLADD
jgi:hypothetical protein